MTAGQDMIAELERLLDDGQVFLAQDLARDQVEAGLDDPQTVGLYALSLIRSGAVEAAEAVLAEVPGLASLDEAADRATYAALAAELRVDGDDDPSIEDVRARLDAMQDAIGRLMARGRDEALGPQALVVLGDCHLELFRRAGKAELLDKALVLFEDAARQGRGARPAAMAAMLRLAAGRRSPKDTGAVRSDEEHGAFWRAILDACQALGGGKAEDAVAHFAKARELARATSHRVTVIRELLESYAAANPDAPAELSDVFSPPRIVVFSGVAFDRPEGPQRCPLSAENAIREAIRGRLTELGAEIGYSSAACGSDLLFIEAMLERGAEVNIVLPFAREDFERERVAYAGPVWARRFEIALKLASSVTYATPGPYLGDDVLYRFGNQSLQGAAIMRGRQFGVDPDLLTVWDMTPGGEIGGVSDFIDQWADMLRLHIIDFDDLRDPPADAPLIEAPAVTAGNREIRALMMSDIVGSSRVTEAQMPLYAGFLNRVAQELGANAPAPTFANTWGDAIFATSPSAVDLATYALALKSAVLEFGDLEGALETPLGMRISLNAGPVLETDDAIAGRLGNFGAEIVRAARIEPVTTPNQIYATDPFVALLLAEENQSKTQAETEGRAWASSFAVQYIGRVVLAKNAGAEGLHHVTGAGK